MFDERTFIAAKRRQWQDLGDIVNRAQGSGLKRLDAADLSRIGSLYRRSCSDLAYARAQRATPGLIDYLNGLVGQAHGFLYVGEAQSNYIERAKRFVQYGLPAVMRQRMPFVLAAFAMSIVGYLVAYEVVISNPANASLFIPEQFKSSFDAWKQGFADHGGVSVGAGAETASWLMTHNLGVGIVAFALGITIVIPAYLMFDNGLVMGCLAAVVEPTGNLKSMWPGILPHGVCELSAIFICGGAGLLIGWSLINPGPYRRRDALVVYGRDATKMLVGTIPMFIIAGILEGNVSHSSIPHWAKYGLALVQFIAIVGYIYGSPIHAAIERRNPQAAAGS